MKPIGLAPDKDVQKYLGESLGLSLVPAALEQIKIPLFKDSENYFLGGHKSFHTVIPDAKADEIDVYISRVRTKYPNIQTLISVPFKHPDAQLVNYILDIRSLTDPEKRFDIYEKKTRNLVRKSYKNDFTLKIEKPAQTLDNNFYHLYKKSIERLGGITKSKDWFDLIEKSLSQKIVMFSLCDSGKLIAANYCILSEKYIFLMFNVSDPAYWEYSINDRLYDELIKWSVERSFDYVDFGPSVLSDDSHSHFKAGFGAQRWYILNRHYGSFLYRFKAFLRVKRYNMRLRFSSIPKHTKQ